MAMVHTRVKEIVCLLKNCSVQLYFKTNTVSKIFAAIPVLRGKLKPTARYKPDPN
jgi:hypothetical protein